MCSTPSLMTPIKPHRRDTNYTSVTPKSIIRDAASKPLASNLTRRRSLSDYRGPSTASAPTPSAALKSANKLGSGLFGSALGKFAQSKLVNPCRNGTKLKFVIHKIKFSSHFAVKNRIWQTTISQWSRTQQRK